MRKFLTYSIVFFVIVLALVLIGPSFVNWNNYKKPVQDKVREMTGLDTVVQGDVRLMLLPSPSFSLENLKITNPLLKKNEVLLTLDKLNIDVDLVGLARGQVNVREISVSAPRVTLYVDKAGNPNWITPEIKKMMDQPSKTLEKKSAPASGSDEKTQQVFIQSLSTQKGMISFVNDQTGSEIKLDDLNISVLAETASGPFNINGDVVVAGNKIQMDASVPMFEPGVENINANLAFALPSSKMSARADVVLATAAPYETQGKLIIRSSDFGDALKSFGIDGSQFKGQKMQVESFVSGSTDALSMSNLAGSIGSNTINGTADIQFDPMLVHLKLESLKNQLGVFAGVNLRAVKSGEAYLFNDTSLSLGYDNKIFLDGRIKAQSKIADLTIRAQLDDVPAFAKSFSYSPEALPKALDKLSGQTTVSGGFSNLKYDAKFKAMGLDLGVAGRITEPYDMASLARVDVSAKHNNLQKLLSDLQNGADMPPSLAGPLNFKATLIGKEKGAVLENIDASLAGTTLKGVSEFDFSQKRPMVKADLTFSDLKIVNDKVSAPVARKSASSDSAAQNGSARWSTKPIAVDGLQAVNLDIALKGKSLTYDRWMIGSPALKLDLQNGVLNVTELKGGLYGGSLSMPLKVQALPGQPLVVSASPNISGVQIEPLVGSFVGSKLVQGSGAVNLKAEVSTLGGSQKELVSNLLGNGTLSGGPLNIKGIDVGAFARALSDDLKLGDSLKSLWGGVSKGGSTSFDTLDGAFDIKQGVIEFTKLDLVGAQADMKTTGEVSLPAWRIDTDHTITVPGENDIPPFTIEINGPLDNPAQTFGQGLLEDYFKRKLERKIQKEFQGKIGDKIRDKLGNDVGNALGGLLGVPAKQQQPANDNNAGSSQSGSEQNTQQQNQQPASNPRDALDSILRGVLR